MKTQTAVEWLLKQLLANGDIRWRGTSIFDLSEQAKAMEKEQIMMAVQDAWFMAKGSNYQEPQAEQYYNETYGK